MKTKNNSRIMPIIKWAGSKRSQAKTIIKYFPDFEVYYEPFVGGGSVLAELNPKNSISGDICEPLIELWKVIQSHPEKLLKYYTKEWTRLGNEGYQVYYEIRDRFNVTSNPLDLFFLSRTCVNGLIRFNRKGGFNNSLHHTRKGIHPNRLKDILMRWHATIKHIKFKAGDYRETIEGVTSKDFVYLDPPYYYTKGRYYGAINYNEFIIFLKHLNKKHVKYALSFDGRCADRDYVVNLPKDLYKRHFFLNSGYSSFRKVLGKKQVMVQESLYLNY